MEKKVSEQLELLHEKEDRIERETASQMEEITKQIDELDKAKIQFRREIKNQNKLSKIIRNLLLTGQNQWNALQKMNFYILN